MLTVQQLCWVHLHLLLLLLLLLCLQVSQARLQAAGWAMCPRHCCRWCWLCGGGGPARLSVAHSSVVHVAVLLLLLLLLLLQLGVLLWLLSTARLEALALLLVAGLGVDHRTVPVCITHT